MSKAIKLLLFVTIIGAVCSGFIRSFVGDDSTLNFAALHVFLFNLATGGLLIITCFAEKKSLQARSVVFYLSALAFTAGAFLELYPLCILSALLLAGIVESVRWKQFEWFPFDFFRAVPVSRKFRQAALLCLSSGLVICAATLLNNNYLELVSFEKLSLHVFFLGFSFPISLSTFSLLFERIEASENPPSRALPEFCFWALNLGVIFFFIFIITELYAGQMLMSFTLFTTVVLTLRMHLKHPRTDQAGILLISALGFLILGSVTGIIYIIVLWTTPDYTPGIILNLHSAATVFGWNMVWLMLTARKDEYPIRINLKLLIGIHWGFVILVPFARQTPLIAIPAVVLLVLFLAMMLFRKSTT